MKRKGIGGLGLWVALIFVILVLVLMLFYLRSGFNLVDVTIEKGEAEGVRSAYEINENQKPHENRLYFVAEQEMNML